jgi:hypothetical protein
MNAFVHSYGQSLGNNLIPQAYMQCLRRENIYRHAEESAQLVANLPDVKDGPLHVELSRRHGDFWRISIQQCGESPHDAVAEPPTVS